MGAIVRQVCINFIKVKNWGREMRRIKIGVIGCGMISEVYLQNCTQVFHHVLEVVAVADLVPELAAKRAKEFNVPTFVFC